MTPKLWDCGCMDWKAGEVFYFKPCGKSECKVYPIVLEESRKRGNRIELIGVSGEA